MDHVWLSRADLQNGAGEICRFRIVGFVSDHLATRLGEAVSIDLGSDNAGVVVDVDDGSFLGADPLDRIARHGRNIDVGERDTIVWLVVEGTIIASRRDGLGREKFFASGGPGQFSGEISDLTGQASLAVVRAGPDGCLAYPFDLPHLRSLIVGSADIGELMMRAFILRRAAFLEISRSVNWSPPYIALETSSVNELRQF